MKVQKHRNNVLRGSTGNNHLIKSGLQFGSLTVTYARLIMKRTLTLILKIMFSFIVIILLITAGIFIFIKTAPQFGGQISEQRLASIRQSPNYKDGEFQNLVLTQMNMKASDMIKVTYDFLAKGSQGTPKAPLPVRYENESNLNDSAVYVTWFGHSALLLEIEGHKILIDPC